jgi:hypothetical protein
MVGASGLHTGRSRLDLLDHDITRPQLRRELLLSRFVLEDYTIVSLCVRKGKMPAVSQIKATGVPRQLIRAF